MGDRTSSRNRIRLDTSAHGRQNHRNHNPTRVSASLEERESLEFFLGSNRARAGHSSHRELGSRRAGGWRVERALWWGTCRLPLRRPPHLCPDPDGNPAGLQRHDVETARAAVVAVPVYGARRLQASGTRPASGADTVVVCFSISVRRSTHSSAPNPAKIARPFLSPQLNSYYSIRTGVGRFRIWVAIRYFTNCPA